MGFVHAFRSDVKVTLVYSNNLRLTYRGYLIFFGVKSILFHRMNTKSCILRVAKPRVKIQLLVLMSELKIILHRKKSNFLFHSCINVEILTYFSPSDVTTEN